MINSEFRGGFVPENSTNDTRLTTSYVNRIEKVESTKLERRQINSTLMSFYDLIKDDTHCLQEFWVNFGPNLFQEGY